MVQWSHKDHMHPGFVDSGVMWLLARFSHLSWSRVFSAASHVISLEVLLLCITSSVVDTKNTQEIKTLPRGIWKYIVFKHPHSCPVHRQMVFLKVYVAIS